MSNFVYLIKNQNTSAVKIGCSKNPRKRLGQLQTGCPDKLILLHQIECNKRPAKHLEKRIQSWFKKGSLRGEWRVLSLEHLQWLMSFETDAGFW